MGGKVVTHMQNNPFAQAPLAGPALSGGETKLICLRTVYGDTLWGIAALFGTSVDEIARINAIDNPDRIFPGRRLYLRVPAAVPIAACESYTVAPGDTVTGIAARLGLSAAGLARDNGLFDPDVIFPGQTLRIVQGETGQPA